jgi:homoserine kinase type II
MAVYTEVSDEDLKRFLAEYDLGEMLSLKGIAEGVENSNFLLHTTAGSYILTLYEKRVNPNDLPYFIGLMEHLSEQGFACPLPIHGKDGESLRNLCGRPAAIISFLEGMSPRRIHPYHCRELGAALARMHLASKSFAETRPNTLSVFSWRPLFEFSKDRAHEVRPGLAEELDRELTHLEANWPGSLPQGVIHADLFPDNAFFLGEELSGVIDFYFACNDAFAYDLAICLNAWCFEPDTSFNITKAQMMLKSYRELRPCTAAEVKALPILARGSAMRFLLTRLHDWLHHPAGAFVKPHDPMEYWKKLQFHQRIDGPGAYGIDL